MASEKVAAIEADRLLDSPLSELTGSQLIDAMSRYQLSDHMKLWPEKKKY